MENYLLVPGASKTALTEAGICQQKLRNDAVFLKTAGKDIKFQ